MHLFTRQRLPTLRLVLLGVALAATTSAPVTQAAANPRPHHGRTLNAGCAIRKTRNHCSAQPTSRLRSHAVNNLTAPFRFFSPQSFWNTPIAQHAPLAPDSHVLVSDLMGWVNREETDKNGPWLNATSEGVTILTVPANQPTVPVALDSHEPDSTLSSAWSAVPLPSSARPSPGDNDLAVWQPSTNTMWEFFQLHHVNDGWEAEWGGAMRNVSLSSGVYGPGAWPAAWAGDQWWWGVTAASFSIVGGAITYEDMKAGQIDHALALVYPNVRRRTFVSPAERDDGWSLDPNALPEGTRLRLDPSLNLAKLKMPPMTRMIARAAQRYGIIIRDQSANIAFIQQDPTGDAAFESLGTKLTDGLYPSQYLASFPWSHLQVMKMDLHQGW
jgi:hypothetical protein